MKEILKNWNKFFIYSENEPTRYQQEFECARRIFHEHWK
jgi:hypothetical protein